MITPLRFGFVISGLLHVAVVAAFSLSSQQEIPAVDKSRPLTLRLTQFKPPRAAPNPPLLAEGAPPQPVVEQPLPRPPEPEAKITPPAAALPPPVAKRAEPKPTKPRPVTKRVSKPRPTVKKPSEPTLAQSRPGKAKPVEIKPVTSPPLALATDAKPQPVASAVDVQEKQHYLAALAAKINRRKFYPLGSRRRGEEGRVVVRFVVQRNGDLTDLSIVESSGFRRLDAAALKTLRRVTPFRPIPEELHRDQWPISVPIAFSLSG